MTNSRGKPKRRVGFLALVLLAGSGSAGSEAAPPRKQEPPFQTSDRCISCHNGISTRSGEDVSFGFEWRATMMANSSRDPYWQAGVRRETMDHAAAGAAIEDECSVCHMPMARHEAKLAGHEGEVFARLGFNRQDRADLLAADGVSCAVCHQISREKLGSPESFVGHFVIDMADRHGERPVYGPFQVDPGRTRIMQSGTGFRPTESGHIRQSELCATCHTLITKALGPQGQVIGELPEQVPYQEWLHSEFRNGRSCQGCHMPPAAGDAPITSVLGKPRAEVSRHTFPGGNFFLQRMLNRYRDELNVAAQPLELDSAALRTVAHLQSEAARLTIDRVELSGARLETDISVENLGGHKLPTAYPSRRVWLHVVVRDAGKRKVFESGALDPQGSIQGNDNDLDATRFEPHYREIGRGDQVQIYEDIMADPAGVPTTGLLTAVRYLKDNRLLPRGFDKRTAGQQVAVVGEALNDPDFSGGGDRVRYVVDVANARGPFHVEAELWYQPVSFRWAANLRRYSREEPQRFTRYYDSMADGSAITLARASVSR